MVGWMDGERGRQAGIWYTNSYPNKKNGEPIMWAVSKENHVTV